MSDLNDRDDFTPTPILAAFRAARVAQGTAKALAILAAHGGAGFDTKSVPAANVAACIAALNAAANDGRPRGSAPKTKAAVLDPVAIYRHWNSAGTNRN